MHDSLCDLTSIDHHFRGWGRTAAAIVLLSLGVGAVTAAFTLGNGIMPNGESFVSCETVSDYASDPTSALSAGIPSRAKLRETVTDAYLTSYEAAGDAVGSLADVSVAADDLGERPIAAIVAAAALALLVLCTRMAARLIPVSQTTTIVAGATLGALSIASLLIAMFGLPAIGLQAIAFAVAVTLLAVRHARASHGSPERSRG